MILDVFRAMGRRWYVVVGGLVLTAGLTWAASEISPPEYNARGLVLLLPGENAVLDGGNPFLALSGLEQPAGIVVAYFASSAAQMEVAAVSESAQFEVFLDDSTRGPVIAVDVTDVSAEATLQTLEFLTDRVPKELERLQEQVGAPADSMITSMPLAIDDRAEADTAGTTRLIIAALAVGAVATVAGALSLDGLLLRRKARRTGISGLASAEDGPPSSATDEDTALAHPTTPYPRTRAATSASSEPHQSPPKPVSARTGRVR
ncbi:hypothetical protein [Microbacterium sp. zg-YB36]|uniref:hypothetical protein n=1 Tax=Microbacterium sp. zg-YB36 TaxID=2969407 RepID=UPI00214CAB48|nr:hypothetical protein [Microbacterium sp. zg-YB36]MDL5352374.1 hypothetical protein [Microbacterium sp. zg-YB36]